MPLTWLKPEAQPAQKDQSFFTTSELEVDEDVERIYECRLRSLCLPHPNCII